MPNLLYAQDWAKGGSVFCKPGPIDFPISGASGAVSANDPLYPEIAQAEAVKVVIAAGPNGENVLETDESGGTPPSTSGVLIYAAAAGFSFAGLSKFEFQVKAKPTTAVFDDFGYGLFWFSTDLGLSALIEFSLQPSPAFNWSLDSSLGPQLFTLPIAQAYFENRWFSFRLRAASAIGEDQPYFTLAVKRDDQLNWTTVATYTSGLSSMDISQIDAFGLGYYGLLGQVTGVRLYDGWTDDNADSEPLGQCCSTAGAAGGGQVAPDGTVTPVGPRQGTAGGVAPSYTPCPGGGALPAASDPTDPQSLDSVEDPILHLKLSAPAGDQRWGASDINAGTTSLPIEARVLRYSEIPSEVLAGRDGVIPTPSFTITVADTDRRIRDWSQDATNRKWLGVFGEILAEAYGQRQLDTAARRLAAGYVADWKFLEDLVAEFTFADVLGWKRSALRRRVPIHTVTKDIFGQGVPEESLGRPIPWLYGELSDDYEWSLDANRLPVGIVPCIPLGLCETIPFVNNLLPLGTGWQAFLLGKVCKTFTAQYMWNGQPTEETQLRARIPVDFPVIVDTMLPTQAGWASYWSGSGHVRVRAIDGTLYDFTMGFARGPRAYEAANTGRFPITYNLWGIEDVGDCTGLVFTDGPTQLAHFIAYGVFANHTSGPWGAIPTLPNGVPVINLTSVAATKAIFDLRLSTGYLGAFTVGATGMNRRTGEEEITAKARGLDIRLGRNHHGQVLFDTVDDLASTSGLVAFDDSMIVEGSFHCGPRLTEQRTIGRYAYGPEPSTGRNTGLEREIRDDDAIADWGEEGGDTVELNEATRRGPVAEDVARRGLLRDSDVPYDGGFTTNLRGTSLSAGQVITITTQWAHWPDDEAHLVKITALKPLGNEDELLTRVDFEDVHRLISTPSTALAGMIGPAWGQPIGSSVGLTSQPIGSSVAGTSRRLA